MSTEVSHVSCVLELPDAALEYATSLTERPECWLLLLQVNLQVEVVRVGSFSSGGHGPLITPRTLPAAGDDVSEDENMRRISGMLVMEWFRCVCVCLCVCVHVSVFACLPACLCLSVCLCI